MSPRIKRTDKSLPRVRSTSKRATRIDVAKVASALGAEPTGDPKSGKGPRGGANRRSKKPGRSDG